MKKDPEEPVQAMILAAREEGRLEGVGQGMNESLEFLRRKYLDDEDRPTRNSPEAKAILEVARELSQHLNNRLVELRGHQR